MSFTKNEIITHLDRHVPGEGTQTLCKERVPEITVHSPQSILLKDESFTIPEAIYIAQKSIWDNSDTVFCEVCLGIHYLKNIR